MSIIVVEGLVKYLNSRRVLSNISWRIDKSGIYSLLGPNGAGKTTLLSIMSGVLEPDEGKVLIKGLSPTNPLTRRIIGYCPQEPGLIDNLSGYDNAVFYGRLYGLSSSVIMSKIRDLASRVGLTSSDLRMKVGKYSGGMKKKLALIIALLHEPEVLILDEPTAGMDPGVRLDVWNMIMELRESGKTIVLATHYMEEADKLSDRVAIIDRGQILVEGTPGELKEKHGPQTVAELSFESEVSGVVVNIIAKYADKYYVDGKIAKLHLDEPDRHLPRVIGELYSSGYRVIEFKLTKPTLEDVFIKLTGKRLRE